MRRVSHPQLFIPARDLTDAEVMVLGLLDQQGTVTPRQAGMVVYRLRGYRCVLRRDRLVSAGTHTLGQLERAGLVQRCRRGWVRAGKKVA